MLEHGTAILKTCPKCKNAFVQEKHKTFNHCWPCISKTSSEFSAEQIAIINNMRQEYIDFMNKDCVITKING